MTDLVAMGTIVIVAVCTAGYWSFVRYLEHKEITADKRDPHVYEEEEGEVDE
jgi:hypothetical protein